MGLLDQNMVKQVVGNTALSLTAGPEESFLVKDIYVALPSGSYVTVKVDRATVGYWRTAGELGNQLTFPTGANGAKNHEQLTILGLLSKLGHFVGYPVAAGETFSLSGIEQSTSVVAVVYDRYNAGDIKDDQPNGSKSQELVYCQYGNSGGSITAAATTLLDTAVNPAEFPAFPFGKSVPDGRNIEVIGICASTFAPTANDATNDIATTYLKVFNDRTVLADDDKNGWLLWDALGAQSADQVGAGQSIIGSFSDTDVRPPLIFDPPLPAVGGVEFLVYLSTHDAGTAPAITIAEQEVGFLMKMSPK